MTRAARIPALAETCPVEEAARPRVVAEPIPALTFNARAFPLSSNMPQVPLRISDQTIDFYAFVFCQGGFRNLGVTFEQFLAVIAVVKFTELRPTDR